MGDPFPGQMMRVTNLDGIGAARVAEGPVLDLLNQTGQFRVLGGSLLP